MRNVLVSASPVVAINRALAIAEIEGPRAALDAMPKPLCDARPNQYQPFWAARAELLARIGACNKAREAYEIALGLERDPAVPASCNGARPRCHDDRNTSRQ